MGIEGNSLTAVFGLVGSAFRGAAGRGLCRYPAGLLWGWSCLSAGLLSGAQGKVGPWNSLRGLCPLRSDIHGRSDVDARCARPPCLSAPRHPHMAPGRTPAQPFCAPLGGVRRRFEVRGRLIAWRTRSLRLGGLAFSFGAKRHGGVAELGARAWLAGLLQRDAEFRSPVKKPGRRLPELCAQASVPRGPRSDPWRAARKERHLEEKALRAGFLNLALQAK